jgi:hypothetical protein
MPKAQLATEYHLTFILGGNATFTMQEKGGNRFTYRVKAKRDSTTLFFVHLLQGKNNERDFGYIGYIRPDGPAGWMFIHGGVKSEVSESAESVNLFRWAFNNVIAQGKPDDSLQVWHEGKCAKCGRKLTVPQSIESGFGPECIKRSTH